MRCESAAGHLAEETLLCLKTGKITGENKLAALDHISGCEDCAAAFSEIFAKQELLDLPPQFVDGVNKKLSQVRITATPLSLVQPEQKPYRQREGDRGKELRGKGEFRRYSCRVAIAACLALFLIFSGTFSTGMQVISKSRVLNPDLSIVNQFTQHLSDFSQNITHWEGKEND